MLASNRVYPIGVSDTTHSIRHRPGSPACDRARVAQDLGVRTVVDITAPRRSPRMTPLAAEIDPCRPKMTLIMVATVPPATSRKKLFYLLGTGESIETPMVRHTRHSKAGI
jgi:hypothetical protein